MTHRLSALEMLSIQNNNTFVCTEIEEFLVLEEFLKTSEGVPSGCLKKLQDGLKMNLENLLNNHKMLASSEADSLFSEFTMFDQMTESIVTSIRNPIEPENTEFLMRELEDEISGYSAESKIIRTNLKDSIKIICAIEKALNVHPDWSTLREECEAIKSKQRAMLDILHSSDEKIQTFSKTFGIFINDQRDYDQGIFPFEEDGISTFEIKKESSSVENEIAKNGEKEEEEEEPKLQFIRYDAILSPERYDVADSTLTPRIITNFIKDDPQKVAVEMAIGGFTVILVEFKEDYEGPYAELEKTDDDFKMAILRMSPLKLFNCPHLCDKFAHNEDGKLIVNLRGHQAMRDRMFLPFQIAASKDYDTIVIDCNFGREHPFLNNPQNLAYTYMAATAAYSSSRLCQFLIAGDLENEFCQSIMNTMGFVS
jgi:hypothetical protein